MCPAVTGVGIRPSSPPSEREVSARSAVIPSQCAHWRGNPSPSAALPRCRDVGDAVPYTRFNIPSRRAGPRAPPKNAYPAAGHMGPALQVHPPKKKKQRGAPCGAPRVFRPCVAQTEEGYIRRFYKREPRGLILKNLSRLLLLRQWSAYRCHREQSGRKVHVQQVQSCQSV